MAGEAAAALVTVQTVQALLSLFESTLEFGAYLCPTTPDIDNITSISAFDYIIVGGGSAGSVLANRLSECSDKTVLVIEAGGCPTLESIVLGYFTLEPLTTYDYNMTSVNDDYTCQNLQGDVVGLTAGKMLGGSSGIHHGIHVRGAIPDYDPWVSATSDSSWSYENLLPYFIKSENVLDEDIVTEFAGYHGTAGPTKLRRQTSTDNLGFFNAFAEQGYPILNDTNANIAVGVVEPLLEKGDTLRQSGLTSYIYPVKDRSNLYVLTDATVTKINFDSDNVATGVQFTYSGTTYTVNATKEVILSAGAIKSPQLLMLSGVGSSDHLSSLNITVVSDQPYVGKNLLDHVGACIVFGLEYDTSTTAAANPFEFPVPMTCNYANLDNFTADYAQFQAINLLFPHDSSGLMQLCMNVFKYSDTICQKIYDANVGRNILLAVANVLHPASTGYIFLNSTNISDQPLVHLGLLTEIEDLVDLASFLAYTFNLTNTSYFKSIGAEFIDLDLCSTHTKYSSDYWQCYGLAMSSTMWHYSGTCAMGTVTDTRLNVKGVSNLRVVDASVFPTIPGGNINAAVLAVAEKAADMIKSDGNLTCTA